MPGLLPDVDPDGLLEYSVVYTDRALNHMSRKFGGVMRDIAAILEGVYGAHATAVIPGSGTFGMEAVARQFATGKTCLVIRNGWFSYRWTQIFEMGRIPSREIVLKAHRTEPGAQAPWAPAPLDEVVATIRRERPAMVFAPHVETAAGMILPDAYLRAVADAVHEVGGLFVLDCIASGAMWVDMRATGVDLLVSAPQKGWTGSPGCAFVMLSQRARAAIEDTTSTSFACDLKKWLAMMDTYKAGSFGYHTTMPTDALARTRDAMAETKALGFELLRARQLELGQRVRALLEGHGLRSVAAAGFQAPGVVVSYTDDPDFASAKAFIALGLQTAAGVPLQCDEGPDFRTFRIGLFGLDKLMHVDRTVGYLETALMQALAARAPRKAA
ncbi:aminotransferase class V-fold PLP-dependent enzyme [Calidifontimicrobium sp. SYSU G02091]|uniref:aminotransferase class V-fold PLP-dependent enzyme n=1 Tax=Calidifontimicrobium sp. SYSU G02091 TaxID=2926421 RepID=UPI001F532105|nr:aminotransferase class V-fold PLP-dependent enzyme [Calidifontimicrobium sp. SYSU G02091]MCI1193202.1 aminotransferase class V-fold PLP-dependent enzyme [Calidifontimicrobium sp. SYSU G02091]